MIRRAVKDLNFGRPVGTGKLGIQWPGLNAPVKIAHYNEKMQKAYEGGEQNIVNAKLLAKIGGLEQFIWSKNMVF